MGTHESYDREGEAIHSGIAGKGQVDVVGLPPLWHVETPIDPSDSHDSDDSDDSDNSDNSDSYATHSDHSESC